MLRIARENSNINHRNFAIKFLAYSLSEGTLRFLLVYRKILQDIIEQSCTEIVDENLLSTLDKMTRDEQYHWVVEGAFAMLRTILSQSEFGIRSVELNLIMISHTSTEDVCRNHRRYRTQTDCG